MFNFNQTSSEEIDRYVEKNIRDKEENEYIKEKKKDELQNLFFNIKKPLLFGLGFEVVRRYFINNPISNIVQGFNTSKMAQANPFNDPSLVQFTVGELAVGKYMLTGLNVFIVGMVLKQVYSLIKKLMIKKMSPEHIAVLEFIETILIMGGSMVAILLILSVGKIEI